MEVIKNHPKLTVLVSILIVGFCILGISLSIKTSTDQTSPNTGTGAFGDGTTLPYSNPLYSISAPVNNTITIDADEGYRNAAVNELYIFGLDPTNYKIVFTYESPFKAYE